jgi:hypothetical protein
MEDLLSYRYIIPKGTYPMLGFQLQILAESS